MNSSKNDDYSDESTSDLEEWGVRATDENNARQVDNDTLQITEVDDNGAPVPEDNQPGQNEEEASEERDTEQCTPISGKNVYIFVVNETSKAEEGQAEKTKNETPPETKDKSAEESKTVKAKKEASPKEVAATKPPRPKKRYAMLQRRRRARKGEKYSKKAKLAAQESPKRSRSRSSVRKRTSKAKEGSGIELKACKESLDINNERLKTEKTQKRRHGVKRSRSNVLAVDKVLKDLQEEASKDDDVKSSSPDKEPEEKRRKLNDN